MKEKIPAEELIPHRLPMRMIESLIDRGEDWARAEACLKPGHMAVHNGLVLESALVECVAQTVAAMEGAKHKDTGEKVAVGLLCGASNFRFERQCPAGKILEIEIQEEKRLGPMLLVSGRITCEGNLVASGEMKLYGTSEETK